MKELWKWIRNFEGSYQVSNLGCVRSVDRIVFTRRKNCRGVFFHGHNINQTFNTKGYPMIRLSVPAKHVVTRTLHRIVGETFLRGPIKREINHKDGNKTNARIDNLEWVTTSENRRHAIKIGLVKFVSGTQHGMAKLNFSKAQAIRMKHLNQPFTLRRVLAQQYGVSTSTVDNIINNKVWTQDV